MTTTQQPEVYQAYLMDHGMDSERFEELHFSNPGAAKEYAAERLTEYVGEPFSATDFKKTSDRVEKLSPEKYRHVKAIVVRPNVYESVEATEP